MPELWGELLASTVMAALVSAAALMGRELIVARRSRQRARMQWRRARARQRFEEHEMLVREVEGLWRHNARLRRSESACQRRCRALEERLAGVEETCNELRRRLEGLVRVVAPEPANLQRGNARDRQPVQLRSPVSRRGSARPAAGDTASHSIPAGAGGAAGAA